MSTDVRTQLAELRRLSIADLKQRWRDLIGADPPQYSRSFLVSRLAYRLQELAYGGLSPSALADMDTILDDAGCGKLGRIRRRIHHLHQVEPSLCVSKRSQPRALLRFSGPLWHYPGRSGISESCGRPQSVHS